MPGDEAISFPGGRAIRLPAAPDPLALHRLNPARYPHLLESAAPGPHGRFDILFAFPGRTLLLDGGGALHGAEAGPEGDFLSALDDWWSRRRVAEDGASPLPFRGGWFMYLGYELAGRIETTLKQPPAPGDLPVAFATRFPCALIRDRMEGAAWLVAETGRGTELDAMRQDLAALGAPPARQRAAPLCSALDEEPPACYLEAVRRTLDYIRDGDVFQANLSRRWSASLAAGADDALLYERLRARNPGPFSGLATGAGQWGIISSSPERLVRVRDGWIETRPIAGTRPRGTGEARDDALSRELLGHPKERAEHIMLLDLERNDLGRVCRAGSVEVSELMSLESYAHVHHIVSNVRGRLSPDVTPGAIVRAVFPGGTITGCPKVRCMEIIAELEGTGRGPYTGSMGYLNRDGGMDLNILIRTMVRDGRRLSLRAGAGIVADSVPERELEETRAKARGLLLALEGVA